MPYLTPLLTGTVAAFLILLTLGLVASALDRRRPRGFEPAASRTIARSGTAVRAAAPHTT
jgi:hypothetical protein